MNQPPLKHLLPKTEYETEYNAELLDRFANLHPKSEMMVTLNCPEFTSLCPITGQPDFATIYVNYIPNKWCVESKSLKLYLFSYRNHGDFHENCVATIMNDLDKLMQPHYIEVVGKFLPRGGISIDPFVNKGRRKYLSFAESRKLNYNSPQQIVTNR